MNLLEILLAKRLEFRDFFEWKISFLSWKLEIYKQVDRLQDSQ